MWMGSDQWGHMGMDPDPGARRILKQRYRNILTEPASSAPGTVPALVLDAVAGFADRGAYYWQDRYRDFRARVDRCKTIPMSCVSANPVLSGLELAAVNHSSEGQSYEALYHLVR